MSRVDLEFGKAALDLPLIIHFLHIFNAKPTSKIVGSSKEDFWRWEYQSYSGFLYTVIPLSLSVTITSR